jgi:hypothetical protein
MILIYVRLQQYLHTDIVPVEQKQIRLCSLWKERSEECRHVNLSFLIINIPYTLLIVISFSPPMAKSKQLYMRLNVANAPDANNDVHRQQYLSITMSNR